MSLSSINLDAFFEVCRTRNFSEAAKHLGVTQSALSQRIMNLEAELGVSLLLREKGNITMTAFGEKLLGYCQLRSGLEEELLSELQGESKEIRGELRVAAFSTITRSAVLPALQKLIRENPRIQLDVMTREVRNLPELLRSGEAHFIFTPHPVEKQGVISKLIGREENVLVTRAGGSAPEDIYIDHDKDDVTTHDFLRQQKQKVPRYQRIFLDEIYAIIDAVENGFGRAVIPKHLVRGNKKLKVVDGLKPLLIPVYLCYKEQPYYSNLQKAFLAAIEADFSLD